MKIWELDREHSELLSHLFRLRSRKGKSVRAQVLRIKKRIEQDKERGILEFCKKYDGWDKDYPFQLTKEEIADGAGKIDKGDVRVLKGMVERVRACHRPQKSGREIIRKEGLRVEEDYVPVERLLIYVPGGRASYPSSLVMAAVPATYAGVKNIYITTPAPGGIVSPYILACAEILGIENVYRIGGAQGIFAFALGIGVPKVDMIVGPGNAYVEEAKKECFGLVGLDTVAGPSELLVLAKKPVFPDLVARDLLSQAEHDEMAIIWLFSPSTEYIRQVMDCASAYAKEAERKGIIKKVLANNAFFVHYESEEMAINVINRIAPEHLQIIGDGNLKDKILYAGITYIGITTPTALGDYYIGTNHILPTGGAGRFLGGLSVETFRRKRVMVKTDYSFIRKYGKNAARMAEIEGLHCHREAINARKEKKDEAKDRLSKG